MTQHQPTRNYEAISQQYIADVLSGKQPACKWVKLACKRQLKDLKRQDDPAFPYRYVPIAGDKLCRFVELCPHVEGRKFAGHKIVLQPWQVFTLMTVFSWLDADGGYRFRRAYTEVPKGSGKSTSTAPIGIFKAFAEGEPGSQVYSAATAIKQAKVVWNTARQMLLNMGQFANRQGAEVEIEKHSLHQQGTNSFYRPIANDDKTVEGINPYFIIVDELHAFGTREFYDNLDTATGKRQGAMLWIITTAGTDLASVCYEVHTEVTKVLSGVLKDDSLFGIIYTIDEKDDWTKKESWIKANPSWGVCVDPKTIEAKALSAQQIPSQQPGFKTKHLNMWLQSDHAWMDMQKFLACSDSTLNEEDFAGKKTIVAYDLSSKLDLMALVKVFWEDKEEEKDGEPRTRRHYTVFGKYWTPEATCLKSDNSQYKGWQIEGLLNTCEGETNDYDLIEQEVKDIATKHDVVEVPYDPFHSHQLATHLQTEGLVVVEVPQTTKYLSEPMKELEAAVYDGRFHYNGDPILAWAVSNVVCHRDRNDNVFPNKERVENKIDPATALLTALNRVMAQEAESDGDGISVFDFCQHAGCQNIAAGVMQENGTFTFNCDQHPR